MSIVYFLLLLDRHGQNNYLLAEQIGYWTFSLTKWNIQMTDLNKRNKEANKLYNWQLSAIPYHALHTCINRKKKVVKEY